MNIGISSKLEWAEDQKQWRCTVSIRVGNQEMHAIAYGDDPVKAEAGVEASVEQAVRRLDRLSEIWTRTGRLNWKALEQPL